MEPIYNNYSEALMKEFPDIKPGSGKSIVFQLCNVRVDKSTGKLICPTSSNVLPFDRIFDPGHNKEIDIAYIVGQRPLGPNAQRSSEIVMGEIVFTRGNSGKFEWFGDRATRELAIYLFFCNANESNGKASDPEGLKSKPWHKEPNSYIIKVLGDEGAKSELETERNVDRAKSRIDEIAKNPKVMQQVKMAMFPQDYMKFTDEQIILKLRGIAQKSPDKIMNLTRGNDTRINVEINLFVKAGLLKEDVHESYWKFHDDTKVTPIGEEESAYEALKKFLLSDLGSETYKLLKTQLESMNTDGAEKGEVLPPAGKAKRKVTAPKA